MDNQNYEKVFKALGNSRRLDIIAYLLKHKEASVGDIANNIKLSFKATSKHLILLSTINILKKEQRNLLVFYYINSSVSKGIKSIINITFPNIHY